MEEENVLVKSLGLYSEIQPKQQSSGEENVKYDVVPDPKADEADLSELRGVVSDEKPLAQGASSETDLENLAELVPDIKSRRHSNEGGAEGEHSGHVDGHGDAVSPLPHSHADAAVSKALRKVSMVSGADSTGARRLSSSTDDDKEKVQRTESMRVLESREIDENQQLGTPNEDYQQAGEGIQSQDDGTSFDEYPDSDHVLEDDPQEVKVPKEFVNMSSANSISTATQTHEVRMPMYLPTFKPATGCTNASDFIVRCFIARLRSGITVVKHGRSRWCKSRLRVLHIHPDGRSLSWKPAEGEPNSSKRPPKLYLSTCLEV